jgi:predicted deacylase
VTFVEAPPRIAGRVRGPGPGPTLIVIGGLHGNEPSGLVGAVRVLAAIEAITLEGGVRGELVLLSGNRGALPLGKRYVDRDLNRGWTSARIEALRGGRPVGPRAAEDLEQLELDRTIGEIRSRARGPVHLLDLHTTSAAGIPFGMVGASHEDARFARHFPLPVIGGLLGALEGVLLDYMSAAGVIALGVEAGQNEDPASAVRHEAVVWIALVAAGLVDGRAVPHLERARALLREASLARPDRIEVFHRHPITPDDGFRMEPGFANIAPVEEGQLLAQDRRGEIRAPERCLVLLPLYQNLGDDGFFLGRARP